MGFKAGETISFEFEIVGSDSHLSTFVLIPRYLAIQVHTLSSSE